MDTHQTAQSKAIYWIRGGLTALALWAGYDLLAPLGSEDTGLIESASEWLGAQCRAALDCVDRFVYENLAQVKRLCLYGHA